MNPLLNWLLEYWKGKERQVVADYQKRFQYDALSMEDLRMFCKVYESTNVPGDPMAIYVNEGRRQVYNHIVKMLSITDDELKPKAKENVDERTSQRTADTTFE